MNHGYNRLISGKKILFWIVMLLLVFTATLYSQQHLSFTEGKKEFDDQKTMPDRSIFDMGTSGIELEYRFTGAFVKDVTVDQSLYQHIAIQGFSKIQEVGAPALPAHNDIIAMPHFSQGNVVILDAVYEEYKGYMVHPALEPQRDTEGAQDPKFEKNDLIYQADAFFPEKVIEVVNTLYSRGVPLAVTQIRPVQFNPVTRTIRVYKRINYRVTFSGGEYDFNRIAIENTRHYTDMLKSNVLNPDAIPDGKTKRDTGPWASSKDYIVITHSEYENQANDLADWKRQLGYSVEVVTRSSWTAAEVKTEVQNRYALWTPKPDYFVIIGDHDGSYAVPGEIHQDPSDGEDFATDLYAACMDGPGDYYPDMAHGRISVSSSTEAQVVVDKIIKYEKYPPTTASFYQNGVNCAQFQDVETTEPPDGYAARRFCHTSEDIRDYMQDQQSYTVQRIYWTDAAHTPTNYNNGYYSNSEAIPAELLRSNGFLWTGASADITASIDAGKFYVFHRDHGYVGGSGWHRPYYTTTSMSSLSNGDLLPVVFSINCHTGEFQLSNCFAEKFLRMENKGAVGMVAAAYYSYSGFNDGFSCGLIDAIWSDPGLTPTFGSGGVSSPPASSANNTHTMGDVVNQGLVRMIETWGDNRYTHELFHWFGDPAMRIWTANPNDSLITATHDDTINVIGSGFGISGSTPYATATIVINNELIGIATLNGSGAGTVPYSFTSMGDSAHLTISKKYHKPYVAGLEVRGFDRFPPSVNTLPAADVGKTSADLNGDIIRSNGSIVTESGFVFSSTDSEPEIGDPGTLQALTSPTDTLGNFSCSVSSLSQFTSYYFQAYATNAIGTSYGGVMILMTGADTLYMQDFSSGSLPAGWQNVDNGSTGEVWVFNNPGSRAINTTTNGNGFAILDSDYYGPTGSQDADLITPSMDFSDYHMIMFTFEHYFQQYISSVGTFAYSTNSGADWNTIDTWSATNTNASIFSQDLSAEVAGEADVIFKWNYVGAYEWYWAVDDIVIEGALPNLTLIAPNGNEDWLVGSSHNITWTSSGTSGNVKIEYKIHPDSSWKDVITSTPDDGTHTWTIPDDPSIACLVKVSDTGGAPADSSDDTFTINAVPAIPQNLTIETGDEQVILKWRKNTEFDLHKYNIYRGISSPASSLIDSCVAYSPPDTVFTDTGLTNGQEYFYRVTAADESHNESGFSNEVSGTPQDQVLAKVKVFLQGPYQTSGDTMTTTVNDSIPFTSPYTDGRTVSSVPNLATDWIYVELRSAAEGPPVAGRSFFLKRDGNIVDEDGVSTDLIITGAGDGNYYIVIHHRSHLAVMSATAHALNNAGATLYDFTVDAAVAYDKYYGGDASLMETGIYGMYAGDGNDSGIISIADGNLALADRDNVGYYVTDYNMSGIVTISDVNLADSNRDKTTAVN